MKIISTSGAARRGILSTPHGDIQTPFFMNVATAAAIKGGVSAPDLAQLGTQVILCNTYHLYLRPGDEVVRDCGGLRGFMRWNAPTLTDSGGFQVFSLAKLRKISEEGVKFASHIDGRRLFLSPETATEIQHNLGADMIMAFDECAPSTADREYIEQSCGLTYRWLVRSKDKWEQLERERDANDNNKQMLFGINQGGIYTDIRREHMKRIGALDLPGYSIGGLAVGETAEVMYDVIENVAPLMPQDKPRYLMGVGTPENLINAVMRGIDMFDCVMPSRNARHGTLFTKDGVMHIGNKQYERDTAPIERGCDCPVCGGAGVTPAPGVASAPGAAPAPGTASAPGAAPAFSRAYLRHLFKADEQLAGRLAVTHNLWFYNNLMAEMREAVETDNFAAFADTFLRRYTGNC